VYHRNYKISLLCCPHIIIYNIYRQWDGYLTQQAIAKVTNKRLPALCLLILFNTNTNTNNNNNNKNNNINKLNLGAHTVCLDINSEQFWSSRLISYCLYLIMLYCRTCIWISFSNLKQMHQTFKYIVNKHCNHIIREMLTQTQTIWNLLHHQHSPYKTTLFYNTVLPATTMYTALKHYSYISNINTRKMYVIN
jgi:hypothetical protein